MGLSLHRRLSERWRAPAYITATYPTRHITLLLGEEDTLPNFRLDQTTCPADAQGFFRRQRGQVFAQFYVPQVFPAAHATQAWALVPGCGHNETCMFGSVQFAAAWKGAGAGSA
ncbi:hypothetical protein WJX81_002500 [Elliptochloris bilobata]|uniref:Uncharacterized protein n=1 Tax=Elliptochloris bilobata TaxID=381761 RepID=A0AAW1S838_9CHLO